MRSITRHGQGLAPIKQLTVFGFTAPEVACFLDLERRPAGGNDKSCQGQVQLRISRFTKTLKGLAVRTDSCSSSRSLLASGRESCAPRFSSSFGVRLWAFWQI